MEIATPERAYQAGSDLDRVIAERFVGLRVERTSQQYRWRLVDPTGAVVVDRGGRHTEAAVWKYDCPKYSVDPGPAVGLLERFSEAGLSYSGDAPEGRSIAAG